MTSLTIPTSPLTRSSPSPPHTFRSTLARLLARAYVSGACFGKPTWVPLESDGGKRHGLPLRAGPLRRCPEPAVFAPERLHNQRPVQQISRKPAGGRTCRPIVVAFGASHEKVPTPNSGTIRLSLEARRGGCPSDERRPGCHATPPSGWRRQQGTSGHRLCRRPAEGRLCSAWERWRRGSAPS
jgi:hypothetical protein